MFIYVYVSKIFTFEPFFQILIIFKQIVEYVQSCNACLLKVPAEKQTLFFVNDGFKNQLISQESHKILLLSLTQTVSKTIMKH